MTKSESIGNLVAALAAAQAAFKAIGKDKTARIQSAKGSFSYRYADFPSAIDATRPALAANGLVVSQPTRLGEGQIVVTSILAHKSGEWIAEEMAWPVADTDNRSIGSGITYARRYGYLSIIGAAAEDEDDDGEAARGGAYETAKPQTATERVKAKVAAQTNGKGTDRVKKIAEGFTALGFTTPDARRAKAEEVLGHAMNPAHESDLDALEVWILGQRNINDAANTLGGSVEH